MLPNYPICIVARIKTIGSLTRCESAGPVGSSPNSRRHPSPAVIVSFHDCLCRLTGWWLSDKLKNATNHRCPFIRLEQHCCCAVSRYIRDLHLRVDALTYHVFIAKTIQYLVNYTGDICRSVCI